MDHGFWYLARASGIVAWVALTASVLWGVLMATKALGRRPGPKWMLDLHRFLGGAAVVLVALHLGSLVLDGYLGYGLTELLVPLASDWRPLAVAWGVVALYLLLAVEVSSLLMKRLPRRWWHAIHLGSYLCFVLVTVHALTAGTDVANPVARVVGGAGVVAITVLGCLRLAGWQRRPVRAGSTRDLGPATVGASRQWTGAQWADSPPSVPPAVPPAVPPTAPTAAQRPTTWPSR